MATIRQLNEYGQSMWLDTIDRRLLIGDGLQQLIDSGISGVTSNPTIFQQALEASDVYDDEIRDLLKMNPDMDAASMFEWLTVRDIQMAADQLRNVYEDSEGEDGYVSLEVSPHLAYNTQASVEAARHLWESVKRPNLMIKIPATPEGLAAIEQLVAECINVNATLLFSVERYEAVAQAYLDGLARCRDPERVSSVASFFVSRIDTKVDGMLESSNTPQALALRGRSAIAQARQAYQRYKKAMRRVIEHMPGKKKPQRLLWASTGVKNPSYPDVLYVDNLIGSDTVITVPQATYDAFVYHGTIRPSLEDELDMAARNLDSLSELGINIEIVARDLEEEGVAKFISSYEAALETLRNKKSDVAREK